MQYQAAEGDGFGDVDHEICFILSPRVERKQGKESEREASSR